MNLGIWLGGGAMDQMVPREESPEVANLQKLCKGVFWKCCKERIIRKKGVVS